MGRLQQAGRLPRHRLGLLRRGPRVRRRQCRRARSVLPRLAARFQWRAGGARQRRGVRKREEEEEESRSACWPACG